MNRLLAMTAAALLTATAAQAVTIRVPSEQSTIQAGIAAAANGDTVLVASGNYLESISLLGKDILLVSEHGPGLTVIYADGAETAVFCGMGESAACIIDGFTIMGAAESGIMCVQVPSPTFRNLSVSWNASVGATCINSTPSFHSVDFEDNGTYGLSLHGAEVLVADSAFRGNRSGIRINDGTVLTLEDSLLDGEDAPSGPYMSGIEVNEHSELQMSGCTVTGFACGSSQTSVPVNLVESASAQFTNSAFENNSNETRGGVLYSYRAEVLIEGCTFSGNSSGDEGGACSFSECTVEVVDSEFVMNTANGGGALALRNSPQSDISGCVFRGNYAGLSGGAVYVSGCELSMSHCLFVSNSCEFWDGAALYLGGGSGEVAHVTIFDCSSGTGWAMIRCASSDYQLTACIVAQCSGVGISANVYEAYPLISYCDIYECSEGNYGGVLPDLTGVNGNISADPLFCDPDAENLQLASDSPCAGGGPGGSDIGVFGVGCTSSMIENVTWGRIKAMYR